MATFKKHPWHIVRPSVDLDYFVMQVPVINTAHITEEDNAKLTPNHPMVIATGDDGCILGIKELSPTEVKGMSEAFVQLCRKFAERGYKHLRLDSCGISLDELPRFDW